MSARPAAFSAAFLRDFSEDFLSIDPSDLATFGRGWTKVVEPRLSAVAFPRSTAEVSRPHRRRQPSHQLHINVMQPDHLDGNELLRRTHEAGHAIFSLVKSYRGSISAEHGIGLLKRGYPPILARPRSSRSSEDPSSGRSIP
ncbi:FAD-linked oxidase C-terminal domain-containing protein [Sorangium sp. So ce887]|uniref:FAD-linked oxidase C-terminal domain-containing protein n=1 Tax=Sorangium sp. So ce887 TaxID=3133324 RepID=UPI003F60172F